MPTDVLSFSRKSAYKLLYLQSAIILIAAIIWAIFGGFHAAWSTLLGGISWLLPNFYFIRKLFIMEKLPNPQNLVKKFYIGELVKFLLCVLLIILFVKLLPVAILPFLSGFIGAVLACWFMPYACKNI